MKFQLTFFFLCITSLGFSQSEVYVYRDIGNNLTIETIKDKKFELVENQIIEKYSDNVFWFKIPASKTQSKYIFKIPYDRYRNATFYQNKKEIKKLKNQRYLSCKFSRENDVYIRVKPKLHSYIPIEFSKEEISILKEKKHLLLNGFYYGFAFLIIIYNLCYYFLFKDDAFLYYALFLASMSFGVFTMDGMLIFLNLDKNLDDFLMILNYVFLSFFSSKFANSYLFLDIFYPKLKRRSYLIGVIIIVLGVLYLIFKNYYFLLFLNIFVFSLLFVYWFCAVLSFNKNVYTKFLVFAYIIILFSGIDYFILKFLGISFVDINSITIKIGAFSEMIILSIAVIYRMNVLKNENENMRSEIISFSKEINELTKNQKVDKTSNLDALSVREREIFDLILLGKSNKDIAVSVNVSVNTVKFHVKNIYEKLNIKSRKEAINLSII